MSTGSTTPSKHEPFWAWHREACRAKMEKEDASEFFVQDLCRIRGWKFSIEKDEQSWWCLQKRISWRVVQEHDERELVSFSYLSSKEALELRGGRDVFIRRETLHALLENYRLWPLTEKSEDGDDESRALMHASRIAKLEDRVSKMSEQIKLLEAQATGASSGAAPEASGNTQGDSNVH